MADDTIERLAKLSDISQDAYKILELEVRRLKKKVSTMSGGLNPHDARQLIAYVKALTDLSKEERELIKALKDLDPERVKQLAAKLVQAKEQRSEPSETVQTQSSDDAGVSERVRVIVRKGGGSSGHD